MNRGEDATSGLTRSHEATKKAKIIMGSTHSKKRRHSKFFSFPVEIQEQVKALLIEPRTTYEDVVQFLKSKGHDWSDSGVERFSKWFFNEIRETEMLRDQAAMLLNEPERALELEKLTATMITKRLAMAMQQESFDVLEHAKIIDAFAKLQRASTQREQYTAEISEKVKKTADAVVKIAKRHGVSDATAADIKNKILLGIKA